jgi:hypothetical protein
MKKNLINEDIHKMMGLIGYNRGKTLTENLMEQASDARSGSAGVRRKWTGKDVGKKALYVSGVGIPIAAAWDVWDVVKDTWGSKDKSTRLSASLNKDSWSVIEKAIKETSYKAGEDIGNKLTVISASEAKEFANNLYDAMDGVFFGAGTYEDDIRDVFDNLGSMLDVSRVAYEYGTRDGDTLDVKLDDELSASDYSKVVANPMRKKPLVVFNGKLYPTLESLLVDIAKEGESEEEGPTNVAVKEAFKRYPCVVVEIDNAVKVTHPYKGNDDQVFITNENGDIMLVNTSGKYVAKVGGEKSSGTIECPDDFTMDSEADLTLSESYIFEQSFGGVKLNPTKVKDSSGAEAQKDGAEAQKDGGESKPRRVEVTYNDITSCKGEVKKGDRGQTVKEIQTNLNRSSKVNPKLKVDGIFGAKTEAAIKQAGGDRVFNCDVAKLLNSEKPEPSVAGEEVTKQEEKAIEVEVNQIKTPTEAEEAMEDTKEEIKTLKQQKKDIRKQKRGLKKIQKMCKRFPNLEACKDTQSLQEWYRR